ncbi:hypothetical protein S7335_1227 [Synechococcus sp. PCC 7335]|nr:hypothetical protein S7335_1227 [Synechococcus sp. PCC 7335]
MPSCKPSQQTIIQRRRHRLKTPDAIVVASASVADAVLLTNDRQLLKLDDLKTCALKIKGV